MARVLITGGTGFLGSQLAHHLISSGNEVISTYFHEPPRARAGELLGATLERLDIRNGPQVEALVERVRPEVVYHFAGQAYVIPSWENPLETFEVNLTGTLHLLEALRRHRPSCALAMAGSGTEYGDAVDVPTPESSPLLPTSPYASSKVAADVLCYQYFVSYHLPVFRYRIFGTTGVGKRGDVCNDFASQIARGEASRAPVDVRVGDLTKRRDILDVRDAVRAMALIVERGTPGEAYNIGSGEARPIGDVLSILSGFATVPVHAQIDPSRIRLVDEPVHLGDTRRLRALGWAPALPFQETLRSILDAWRAESRAASEGPAKGKGTNYVQGDSGLNGNG